MSVLDRDRKTSEEMRIMQWPAVIAIAIGTLIILFPVAFIWYLNVGGIYAAIKTKKEVKLLGKTLTNLICSIDTDCPRGFVCFDGRCVPAK